MRIPIILPAVLAFMVLPFAAQAAKETRAILSPKCSAAQLKKIAGAALIKIVPSPSGNAKIFNITLHPERMTFAQLTQKMVAAKCF